MAKLIFTAITSLDGYIEDEAGNFDWAAPDEEVHAFINDLERPVGTYLYGRRMYETMAVWETDSSFAVDSPLTQDYAQIWESADKIVYSTTLDRIVTTRTRLEHKFDPGTIRQMKAASRRDFSIGGSALAAEAFRAGLVDECSLFLTPIIVGGGKKSLPDNISLRLELLDEHRFGNGMVYLRYRILS
jgi:dihydrofolate reductase